MIIAHPHYLAKHSKPMKIRQKYDVGGVRTRVYVRWCTYAGVRTLVQGRI